MEMETESPVIIEPILPVDLNEKVKNSSVLVVGAGGIGCELLKNLVLTGFPKIEIIDLDTIEVSNLNRQFLFRREHVGKPKAIVATESALQFNPNVSITPHHGSIMDTKYDVNFYKKFDMVLNALDNRQARSHVNRMCLAADVPLVESGSAGYLGNVKLHKKGVSECYDCVEKSHQKTYPGCTIRNTPSEPIHCIIWAKYLFSQLFGIEDADEDVSPDSSDPEAISQTALNALSNSNSVKISTRTWAKDSDYNSTKLVTKFFVDDILYLLSMEDLWKNKNRSPPTPLDKKFTQNNHENESNIEGKSVIERDNIIWTIGDCVAVFRSTVEKLRERVVGGEDYLVWDKDDDVGMDFVTACANIRSHLFSIPLKTRFEIKSMAGNIIPAIPATNSIVAGLIVMTAFKVLLGKIHECHTLYVSNRINSRGQLFGTDQIVAPNPKCYVCAQKPEVVVRMDLDQMTVGMLGEKVLKKELNMVEPDVEIDDGEGTILISSEEGETDAISHKLLSNFNIGDGTRLKCDDFFQDFNLVIIVMGMSPEHKLNRDKSGEIYEIVGDRSKLIPNDTKIKRKNEEEDGAGPSKIRKLDESDDIVEILQPKNAEIDKDAEVQICSSSSSSKKTQKIDEDDDIVEISTSKNSNFEKKSDKNEISTSNMSEIDADVQICSSSSSASKKTQKIDDEDDDIVEISPSSSSTSSKNRNFEKKNENSEISSSQMDKVMEICTSSTTKVSEISKIDEDDDDISVIQISSTGKSEVVDSNGTSLTKKRSISVLNEVDVLVSKKAKVDEDDVVTID